MVLTLTLITLTLTRWEIGQPNNIVASRTQLPLRLAWGMTVHAAQGLTIDRLQVDLGRIFADGQACLARTPYSLLTTYFLLLTTRYSLLTTHNAQRTTHHSPRTTHHSPLATHHPTPTTWGQAYVALSRASSAAGLRIVNLDLGKIHC